jgi:hypothetical protein
VLPACNDPPAAALAARTSLPTQVEGMGSRTHFTLHALKGKINFAFLVLNLQFFSAFFMQMKSSICARFRGLFHLN